jgi:hypothetical protein
MGNTDNSFPTRAHIRVRQEYDGCRVLTLLIVTQLLHKGEEMGQTWRHPALEFGSRDLERVLRGSLNIGDHRGNDLVKLLFIMICSRLLVV